MDNPGALAASIVEAMADPLLGPDGSRDDQWALLPQDDSKPRRDASSRSWALDRCGVLTRQERYVNGGPALILAHHTTTYRDLERLLPTVLSRKTERRTAAVDIGQISET